MKVATTQPFQITYSLFRHEYLGYLVAAFAVQVNSKGNLTLQYQGLSARSAKEFAKGLDEHDWQLIKLCDSLQIETIIKKFYAKKIHHNEFFLKIYDKQKGDKALQEAIAMYVDEKISQILSLIFSKKKPFFVMGTDGNPIWQAVEPMPEPVSVLFHFRRDEKETHYFPTLRFEGKKLDFQFKNALILCNEPAWMLLDNCLYHFKQKIDGNKLRPFLQKWYINIPRNVEETYFKKFLMPLIAAFDVYAQGFEIRSQAFPPKAFLAISQVEKKVSLSLFELAEAETDENPEILFELYFQYGNQKFKADDDKPAFVSMEKVGDNYVFHRIAKNLVFEKNVLQTLKNKGLDIRNGRKILEQKKALDWLEQNAHSLQSDEISILQHFEGQKKYFLGQSHIEMKITENKDWFDLQAIIRFGEFEVPFVAIRPYILSGKKEFPLPNGNLALIPEEWFSRYSDLFYFAETHEKLSLQKYHLHIVEQLSKENWAEVHIQEKLRKMLDFAQIDEYPLPQGLKADLRNYQKSGYNWLRFLGEYQMGGFLADDMGLGKTLQTLALLQAEKENNPTPQPCLVVVPTSLIYNWEVEAKKFAPHLQIITYTGSQREQKVPYLSKFDVVLTSYGVVRIDAEILAKVLFNYIILDESQAIKNPQSNISQAVMLLRSKKRLLLTGTPVENSLMDLWSQMNFANHGLLGSKSFFRKEFLQPIERGENAEKAQKLHQIVKPFILRRTKEQVAQDLPQKIEHISYCPMTAEQEKYYEEVKSQYRNKILEQIEQQGIAKTQFFILKGLTQLRQIANHPQLVEKDFQGNSGKMEDVRYKLETLLEEKKKVLVFSQFVKHLALIKTYLEQKNIKYAYLDGASTDRQAQVERFQKDENIQIFLISIKAGGVGLNLTAAEYVFLLDPWWNPAVEAQAIDRAHRIGQRHTVIAYKFITKNSVEEKILALQEAKKRLASDIISTEENFFKSLSTDDIRMILE
jgi:SNF2 family DNA or RNA helicase